MFNRFWRADPSRQRRSGGTGLGLAISLEDARLHDGWLQAWGEVDRGAAFRLTLPRRLGDRLRGSPLPLVPVEAARRPPRPASRTPRPRPGPRCRRRTTTTPRTTTLRASPVAVTPATRRTTTARRRPGRTRTSPVPCDEGPSDEGPARLVLAVVVALGLLAGCATVPGSSDVTVLRRVGDAAEPTAPPGPVRGAGPLETVRGWVLASGATPERHQAARAFLTSAAAGTWDDGAAPTVVSDQVATVFADRPVAAGQSTVRLRATALGTVTPEGAYVARPGPVEFDLELVEQNGQWRIASLPAGTIVRRSDLTANTRPVRTWFVDPWPAPRCPIRATWPPAPPPRRPPGPCSCCSPARPRRCPARRSAPCPHRGPALGRRARRRRDRRRRPHPDRPARRAATPGDRRAGRAHPGRDRGAAGPFARRRHPAAARAPEITVADALATLPPEVARRPDLPVDPVAGAIGGADAPPLVTDGVACSCSAASRWPVRPGPGPTGRCRRPPAPAGIVSPWSPRHPRPPGAGPSRRTPACSPVRRGRAGPHPDRGPHAGASLLVAGRCRALDRRRRSCRRPCGAP